MPLCVSPASSSSLEESTTVCVDLRGVDRVGRVGVVAALLEASAPMVAGDDFAAGEKDIFVCRLRLRALLAIVAVKGSLMRRALRQ
jgi:hypothetical protein